MTLKHQSFYKAYMLGILSLFMAGPSYAWNDALNRSLRKLDTNSEKISLHSFGLQKTEQSVKGLKLGTLDFKDTVHQILRNRTRSPFVGIKTNRGQNFFLQESSETVTSTFTFRNIEFCDFEVKAHRTPANDLLVLGRAPQIRYNTVYPWPTKEAVASTVEGHIYGYIFNADQIDFLSYKPCYLPVHGEAQPVFKVLVNVDGRPYFVTADHQQVFGMEAAYFDVTGYAKIYPNNTLAKSQKQFTLENLTGDGTLTSNLFETVINNPDYERAKNSDHKFFYDKNDMEYGEVAAFTHVNIHLQFFEDLGYKWNGPKPLKLYVHEAPNNNTNNALYVPAQATGMYPQIIIGDGDGNNLQNLTFDGDVVSHEFGHHIIYQTVKTTEGESIVIHEGLADYFAFARTNDPCLGNSICPEDSPMCWRSSNQLCLRTADNDLAYKDSIWNQLEAHKNRLTHQHSQMLSGYLWDLREREGIPAADVTKLAYRATSLLMNSSGIQDFLYGMLHADKELFDSKYFDTIISAASNKRRGMAPLLAEVGDDLSSVPLPSLTQDPSTSTSRSKSSSSGPFACGTIGGRPMMGIEALFIALALLLPLWFVRASATVPAERPQTRRRPQ